jgi:hypothetical protein
MITIEQLQERPLSYSSLKEFAKSPRHYLDYLNRKRETTPAMLFGSMVHCLLLEPSKFNKQFAVMGTIDKRTTAGKEAYAKFVEESVGKDVVMENDYNEAMALADNVLSNTKLAPWIQNCHQYEQEFRHEVRGLPIRGFFDGVAEDYILEVKTTMDASPENLMRDFYNRQYHMQAGIYNIVSDKPIKYLIIETRSPYDAYIADATDNYLKKGHELFSDTITRFNKCMEDNEWHKGYEFNSPYIKIDLPSWVK